ncbi:MAG: hypothetical protein HQK49_17315 [Oligoflexia bacterium]|nr:hypothetical protein [Oligoflexia bacterium]
MADPAQANSTSDKKIAANKANSKMSTGPRLTDTTRYNAVRSGVFSSNKTLATQWDNVFADLISDVYNDLAPTNEVEGQLCTMIASDFFRINLLLRYEYGQILSAANFDSAKLGQNMDLDQALKISRYATSAQNRILKTLTQYKAMKAASLPKENYSSIFK